MNTNTINCTIIFLLICGCSDLSFDKDIDKYVPKNFLVDASRIEEPSDEQQNIVTWSLVTVSSNQPKNFVEIDAEVVFAEPRNGCSKLTNAEDVNGKIVVIDANDCYPQEKIKHAQEAGAAGVMIEKYPFKPSLSYISDGKDHSDLTIAAVQLKSSDKKMIEEWIANNQTVKIMLSPDDDPWDLTYGNDDLWNAFIIFYGLWDLILIGIASKKILAFWKYKPKNLKISVSILVLQIITLSITLTCGLDIIGIRGWYAEVESAILASAHFPFFLTSYFLLGLYWMSAVNGIAPKFANLKIPIMISVPIFFIAEMGSWIPRAMFWNPDLVFTALITLYCLFILAVSIFYLIQAHRIRRVFRMYSRSEIVSQLRLTNAGMIAIACFFLLIVLNFAVYLFFIGVGPVSNTWLFWSSAFFANFISSCMIAMFPTPKGEGGMQSHTLSSMGNRAGEPDSETMSSDSTSLHA